MNSAMGSVNVQVAERSAGALRSVAVVIGCFWLAVLLHEAAHYSMAWLLDTTLQVAPIHRPSGAQLVVVSSGPLTTLAVVALSALIASRSRAEPSLSVIAFSSAAAARLLPIAPITFLGRAVNDEATIHRLVGVSPRVLWLLEAAIAAALMWIVLSRVEPRNRRRVVVLLVVGNLLGLVTALTLGRAIGLPI
jgi:hypothetical protein